MSYYTAFSSEVPLAGAIAMSGYLPLAASFEGNLNSANLNTPLLACHGEVGTYQMLMSAILSSLKLENCH